MAAGGESMTGEDENATEVPVAETFSVEGINKKSKQLRDISAIKTLPYNSQQS